MKFRYKYIITSCRAWRRSDEEANTLFSNAEYKVGDIIYLDGLAWYVEEVSVL